MVKLTTVIITLYVFSSVSSCLILALRVVTVSESVVFLSVDSRVSTLLRVLPLTNTFSPFGSFRKDIICRMQTLHGLQNYIHISNYILIVLFTTPEHAMRSKVCMIK